MEMKTFDEYQREVERTGSCVPNADEAKLMRELSLVGLGVAGEAGEVADLCKKIVHHRYPLDEDRRAKLIAELGDVLWYISHGASVLGVTLEDVAQGNIDKLKRRYPEGFSTAASMAKADDR
jgi:NTP pyrophosphatase (non-canonical NTP hydrolase)